MLSFNEANDEQEVTTACLLCGEANECASDFVSGCYLSCGNIRFFLSHMHCVGKETTTLGSCY